MKMTNTKLDKEIVSYIIEKIIKNFFPNITSTFNENIQRQKKIVAQIYNKPTHKGILCKNGRYELSRVQTFSSTESAIIENIFNVALEHVELSEIKQKYFIANSIPYIIAKTLSGKVENNIEASISQIINKLEYYAQDTYEGKNTTVSWALNYNEEDNSSQITFDEYMKEAFSKILSNVDNSLVIFNSKLFFLNHQIIDIDTNRKQKESLKHELKSPYKYSLLAQYTQEQQSIVFVLNKNREILIFLEGKLVFSKRRGEWRYFNEHLSRQIRSEMRLSRIPTLKDKQTKNFLAVYDAILDASFSKIGASITILSSRNIHLFKNMNILKTEDIDRNSIKFQILNKIIKGKAFYELERKTRLELLHMDGALILSSAGEVIAAGAILNIQNEIFSKDPMNSNSSEDEDENSKLSKLKGGARLAVAKALSKYGVSIKISSDGEVTSFYKNNFFIFG